MEKKKMSKVIAAIIAAIALVLIVVAVVISLLGDNKIKEKSGYKQCAKSEDIGEKKLTNFKHTGLNYYIDKENNRINNSEVLSTKHHSLGDETKKSVLSIENMTIISKNCDENAAEMNAKLINNSEIELSNFMLMFDILDQDGNKTYRFSIDVDKIAQSETIPIKFNTKGRIIDAYDYEFTFVTSSDLEG